MPTVAKFDQEPQILNIAMTVDDDLTWTAFFEKETLTPGVFAPWDLDDPGISIQAMIKKRERDDAILETFTVAVGSPLTTGWVSFSLTDAETKALGNGKFYYSVRITEGTYTRTYLAGEFNLTRRATYD